jgi:hypothetical protein
VEKSKVKSLNTRSIILYRMYYATYEDAVRAHNTKIDLHIIENNASYVKIGNNGNIIKYPGFGIMKTPGHPSANQMHERQQEFIHKYAEQGFITVFYSEPNEVVKFLGNYRLISLKKTLSFEGFQYYEYTFHRISKNKYF